MGEELVFYMFTLFRRGHILSLGICSCEKSLISELSTTIFNVTWSDLRKKKHVYYWGLAIKCFKRSCKCICQGFFHKNLVLR